jgi:predicted amidohydrolase YtcJ
MLPTILTLLAMFGAEHPDLIVHHAKVVTVDAKFTITEAIAVKNERIVAVSHSRTVRQSRPFHRRGVV